MTRNKGSTGGSYNISLDQRNDYDLDNIQVGYPLTQSYEKKWVCITPPDLWKICMSVDSEFAHLEMIFSHRE